MFLGLYKNPTFTVIMSKLGH